MSLNMKQPFLMSYLEMFINYQIYGFGEGAYCMAVESWSPHQG